MDAVQGGTQTADAARGRAAAQALRKIIQEHFDFAEVYPLEEFPRAHQRRHRKLIVPTDQGRFVVKTYKGDPLILDNLRFQHRLSDHLLKHGLPVAYIQPAKSGRRIVEIDDWALELQQFVEGQPMQVTAKTLERSSEALGKFHLACRDFPRPDRDTRMWRFSQVPREMFGRLYEQALETGKKKKVDAHCNAIALFLRAAGEALSLDHRSEFETGLIHGDWHSGNLLFVGEKLSGILDLEFAGDGCYLEDLSYATSNLCIRTTTDVERLERRVTILLDNYQIHRSLAPAEERALYYAVGMKHVATVAYQCRQMPQGVAGHDAAAWMGILAAQCEWLSERARRVHWGR